MALEFLGTLGNVVGTAAPIAQGIAGLMQAFGKDPYKQAYQAALNEGPTAAEQRANSLFEALLQPNNSLVKQMSQDNLQQGMSNFLMQLKQAQMMDARRMSRGQRGTFFNPERADETISYLTTRGLPAISRQATEDARNQIAQSAAGIAGQIGPQAARQQRQLSAMQTNAALQAKTGGLGGQIGRAGGGIQDLLKAIQNAVGGGSNPTFIGPMPNNVY